MLWRLFWQTLRDFCHPFHRSVNRLQPLRRRKIPRLPGTESATGRPSNAMTTPLKCDETMSNRDPSLVESHVLKSPGTPPLPQLAALPLFSTPRRRTPVCRTRNKDQHVPVRHLSMVCVTDEELDEIASAERNPRVHAAILRRVYN